MRVSGVGAEGEIGSGGDGGHRCPAAATRPHSRHGSIKQSANMLGNIVSLKLENSIIISNN